MRSQNAAKRSIPVALLAILTVCMAADSWAQGQLPRRADVDPATRNAAIRRVLTDRLRQASSLGRATAVLHRSLIVSSQLADAAAKDLGNGARPSDSEAANLLALELGNVSVSLEAIQVALMEQRVTPRAESDPTSPGTRIHGRTAERRQSESRESLRRSQRSLRGRVLRPGASPFDEVERLVALQTRLDRAIREGQSARVVEPIVVDIQAAVHDTLGKIRRETRPPTGIVLSSIPEVRQTPIEIGSEGGQDPIPGSDSNRP